MLVQVNARTKHRAGCLCTAVLLLCATSLLTMAQDGGAPAKAAGGAVKLTDLSFLTGTWHDASAGGALEEQWSTAHRENMTGMFRWLKADGKPQLFELMTLTREGDDLILRVKHLTPPELKHWPKEAEQPTTLRLRELTGRKAVFESKGDADDLATATYDASEPGILRITLEFRAAGRTPIKFALKQGPLPADA